MQPFSTSSPTYSFSSFTETKARKAFNLTLELSPEGFLEDWMKNTNEVNISNTAIQRLQQLQKKLNFCVRFWNEQELRERFIMPVIELVDFDMFELNVASFAERPMSVTHKNSIIQGKVEWMVATGVEEPEHPFFFVHEYKKEKEAANDPLGQLLATLSVAKLLNEKTPKPTLFNPTPTNFANIPLYGCYVIGRLWFFVRLKEERYCISKAYDSTDEQHLLFIFKMLKAQKEMIIQLVKKL